MDGTSRVTGDCHARFCERLGVKVPGATRRRSVMAVPTATAYQPLAIALLRGAFAVTEVAMDGSR